MGLQIKRLASGQEPEVCTPAFKCLDLQVKNDTAIQRPLTITITRPHASGRELEMCIVCDYLVISKCPCRVVSNENKVWQLPRFSNEILYFRYIDFIN